MRVILTSIFFLLFSINIKAEKSIAEKVCNAYQDNDAKKKCFLELQPPKKKETAKSNKNTVIPKLIDEQSSYKTFDIIQKAFIGSSSKTLIKFRLEKAMKLYNTPITINNYHKCASSLVAMRKYSGFSEMAILDYMIRMHSTKAGLDFPSGAAFAATLMTE